MTNPDTNTNKSLPLNEADMQHLADVAKAQAQVVMAKIPVLGAVAWLMMQQAGARHTLLSEMEWRVMPPLVMDQAKLYMRDGAPVAYVSWAQLSEKTAQRYLEAPHHLMAADWKSGDQIWIIDLVTPFGGAPEVMKELRETVFASKAIYQMMPDSQGQAETLTWPAVRAES